MCSQFYAQREWVVGELVSGEGGQQTFQITLPLTFTSTVHLMETIHEQFDQQTVSVNVLKHTLIWDESSFTRARAVKQVTVLQSLSTACKCGAIPKHKQRRQGKHNVKRTTRTTPTSAQASVPPGRRHHLEGEQSDESDASDSSLLSALAKALDGHGSDHEGDADEQEGDILPGKGDFVPDHIQSLSTAVASSSKYSVPKDSAVREQRESQPDFSALRKEVQATQHFEEMVDSHNVENAIKHLRSSKKLAADSTSTNPAGNQSQIDPFDQLPNHLGTVRAAYGSLMGPEEEAEEGLLSLASFPQQRQVESSQSTQPVSDAQQANQLSAWATALANVCLSFHRHEAQFFPALDSFDDSMARSISLVQFVEGNDQSAVGHFIDQAMSEGGEIGSDQHCEGGSAAQSFETSTIQFVHWDFPRPPNMTGRRLRIEANRFVWKPPSRNIHDDNLRHLFETGKARVLIADVGAALVKAKGQFRTEIPPHINNIFRSLTNATHGLAEAEASKCFICNVEVNSLCPTCGLWSHHDCCDALMHSVEPRQVCDGNLPDHCSEDGEGPPLQVADAVTAKYMSASSDREGLFAASLVRFDNAEQIRAASYDHDHSHCSIRLLHCVCPLCKCIFRSSLLPNANTIQK